MTSSSAIDGAASAECLKCEVFSHFLTNPVYG